MSFMLLGILNSQVSGGGASDFDLLETTTLASSASSVTFSGLDAYSDYKHLQIRFVSRASSAATSNDIKVNFNSDTGANYAYHLLYGDGSSVAALASTTAGAIGFIRQTGDSATAGNYGMGIIDILDFNNTSKNTTLKALSGNVEGASRIRLSSGFWNNTNAVTSIALACVNTADFVAGSRYSLYGVK